jgi:hypothetical protein
LIGVHALFVSQSIIANCTPLVVALLGKAKQPLSGEVSISRRIFVIEVVKAQINITQGGLSFYLKHNFNT